MPIGVLLKSQKMKVPFILDWLAIRTIHIDSDCFVSHGDFTGGSPSDFGLLDVWWHYAVVGDDFEVAFSHPDSWQPHLLCFQPNCYNMNHNGYSGLWGFTTELSGEL